MFIVDLVRANFTIGLCALLLSFAVPYLIIYALHELRFRRLRLLKDCDASFSVKSQEAKQPGTPGSPEGRLSDNPSFEFVRSKYVADIDDDEFANIFPGKGSAPEIADKINLLLSKRPGFFVLKSNRRLLVTAFGFVVLTFLGFLFGLMCLGGNAASLCPTGDCTRVFFIGGLQGTPDQLKSFEEQLLTVMTMTFIGAYVSAVREFLRRMSVFDLTSYTFLKQSAEIFASVVFVAFLYRAFPDPAQMLLNAKDDLLSLTGNTQGSKPGYQIPSEVSWAWIALAPLFGLFPESATRYLFIRAGKLFNWIKAEDNRFNSVTRCTPLDVIDGVDYWTRIRLEQCGIYDVQNLATYNPIMLYIETPFGFYEVFDWIAQAQLCHIIGIEKFLLFRENNIRTIFDLERAIRGIEAGNEFDDFAASVLLATTSTMKDVARISGLQPIIPGPEGTYKAVDVADFSVWARTKFNKDEATNSKAMEHLADWISDDLHVRRLRLLWKDVSDSLGKDAVHLDDDKGNGKDKSAN